MAVKMALIISAALKGKDAFKNAQKGFKGVASSTNIATIAMRALSAVAVAAFFKDSISKAAAYSDQMMAVQAATQATEQEFKALDDKAREIGRTFGKFTASDAAEGMRVLSYAGFEVDETLTAIEPVMKLSQAGMMELGNAADSVAGSLRSFGFEASDTGMVVDVMTNTFISSNTTMQNLSEAIKNVGPIASQAGMSFEEMNATLGTLANSAIKGGRAGTALRNILVRLQAPSGKAKAVLNELGVQLFELSPAAQSAQRALNRDYKQLTQLEQQMDEVSAASSQLQASLNKLNIQESKNTLEIMKIRDKAADENRDLSKDEEARIKELESANDDLAIQQMELSIQQDELNAKEKELKASKEETTLSIKENTDAMKAGQGQMKSMADIAVEFNKKLQGLNDAQKTQALNTVVGRRSLAAFQVILRSMSSDAVASGESLTTFTQDLQNSGGTADQVSATMEQGLGNQIKQTQSAFEDFQLTMVEELMPTLLELMDIAREDLIPALEELMPTIRGIAKVVGILVGIFAPLLVILAETPGLIEALVIALIAWQIAQLALNIAMTANPIGIIIVLIGILIVSIWVLVANWEEVSKALGTIFNAIGSAFMSLVDNITQSFKLLGFILRKPFEDLWSFVQEIVEKIKGAINEVKEAPGKATGKLGDLVGKATGGLLSFQGGGTVPGPIGEPQLAVVHGGEDIYPPGESPGNNIVVNSNDEINVNFSSNQRLTNQEIDNISTQLADQIATKKRRADINRLLESG